MVARCNPKFTLPHGSCLPWIFMHASPSHCCQRNPYFSTCIYSYWINRIIAKISAGIGAWHLDYTRAHVYHVFIAYKRIWFTIIPWLYLWYSPAPTGETTGLAKNLALSSWWTSFFEGGRHFRFPHVVTLFRYPVYSSWFLKQSLTMINYNASRHLGYLKRRTRIGGWDRYISWFATEAGRVYLFHLKVGSPSRKTFKKKKFLNWSRRAQKHFTIVFLLFSASERENIGCPRSTVPVVSNLYIIKAVSNQRCSPDSIQDKHRVHLNPSISQKELRTRLQMLSHEDANGAM